MYTAKDASVAHLAITQRMQPTNTSALFAEYFAICQLYSDTLVARETHRQYITQVEHMRLLLITQKKQKSPAGVYTAKQSGGGQGSASESSAGRSRRRGGGASASSTTELNTSSSGLPLTSVNSTGGIVTPVGGDSTSVGSRQSPSEASAHSIATAATTSGGAASGSSAGTSGTASSPEATGKSSGGVAHSASPSGRSSDGLTTSDAKRKGASTSLGATSSTVPASAATTSVSGSSNNPLGSASAVSKLHGSGTSKEAASGGGSAASHTVPQQPSAPSTAAASAPTEAKRRRSGPTGAANSVNISSFSIIRSDWWGSEYYMETCYKRWNTFINQLSDELVDPVLAWVSDNDKHPCSRSIIRFTNRSAYDAAHGMCYLRWSTWSEVKNYVDALHAVVNAPLSSFYTPLAIGLDVLGVPVLCLSLAPVSGPWNDWDQVTPVWHAFCAMCASLRLMKPLKHAEGGRSDDVRLNMGGLAQALGLSSQSAATANAGSGPLNDVLNGRGGNGGAVPSQADEVNALVAAMRAMGGANASDNVNFALRNSVLSMGAGDGVSNLWDASVSAAGVGGWSPNSPASPTSGIDGGVSTSTGKRSVFYAGLENYVGGGGPSLSGVQGTGANPFNPLQQQVPQQVRSHAMQNSAVREDVGRVSPFVAAVGADARWYFIDARALTLYQVLSRRSFVAGRMPRREMYSSLNGCLLRDCGPNELVLQTKLRTIVSQLINGFSTHESILLSTLCHKHGVRYGPYVYTILDLLKAEEKQLTQALQTALRQGSSSPNVQARVQQCVRCIQAVLGELLARAVKHLIRHRWFTTTRANVNWLTRLHTCVVAKYQADLRNVDGPALSTDRSSPPPPRGAVTSSASPEHPFTSATGTTGGTSRTTPGSNANSGFQSESTDENSQGRITVVPDIDRSLRPGEDDSGAESDSLPHSRRQGGSLSGPRHSDTQCDDTAGFHLSTPQLHRDSVATAVPSQERGSRRSSLSGLLPGFTSATTDDEARILKAAEAAQLQHDLQDLEQPFIEGMLHVLEGVFQVSTVERGVGGGGAGGTPPNPSLPVTGGTASGAASANPSATPNNSNSHSAASAAASNSPGATGHAAPPVVRSWAYPPFNPALANVQFRPDVFEELLFLVNDLYIFRMYAADERNNEWQLVRRRAPVILRRGGGSRSRSASQRRRDAGDGASGGGGGKGSSAAGGGGNRFLSTEEERITARPSELNAGWSLQCLQEILGMPLIIRDGKIDVLRDANGNIASQSGKLFEQILTPGFALLSERDGLPSFGPRAGGQPVRQKTPAAQLISAPYANTLEVPMALRLPSRDKALEYAQEQRQIGLRICALSAQMSASSMGVERALHYARMGRYVQLHAADIRIACRGWPLSEDFEFIRRGAWSLTDTNATRRGSVPTSDSGTVASDRSRSSPLRRGGSFSFTGGDRRGSDNAEAAARGVVNTSADDIRIQTAFQADMQYRLCLLNSKSDLREALRAWWAFSERAESIIKSSTAYGQVVRLKIFLLLNIATTFAGPAVSRALEVAVSDLDVLTGGLANIHTLTGSSGTASGSVLGNSVSFFSPANSRVVPRPAVAPMSQGTVLENSSRVNSTVSATGGNPFADSSSQHTFVGPSGRDRSHTVSPPPPLMSPARVAPPLPSISPGRLAQQHGSALSISSSQSGGAMATFFQSYGGSGGGAITSVGFVPSGASGASGQGAVLAGVSTTAVNRSFDLRAVQCAELYFLLLTSLVKHTLVPNASMTPKESVSRAMTFCALRRELIVVCYGESSLEAAAAANDLGMLFMRDPTTHVAATEEFHRARDILTRHLRFLRLDIKSANDLLCALPAGSGRLPSSSVPASAGAARSTTSSTVYSKPPSGLGAFSTPGSASRRRDSTAAVTVADTTSAQRRRGAMHALGPSILRDTPIATSLFPREGNHYAAASAIGAVTSSAGDGVVRRSVLQRHSRSEVLETLLHVEKALHSVQNNIAFLYCYEARDQYYSSQFLFLEYVEDARRRGVIARPAIGEQLYAKRRQKKAVVESLLAKAEEVLSDVLSKEAEVPVFDYAVALNNMACVHLYRNHLVQARALVVKSLAITAQLCSITATVLTRTHQGTADASVSPSLPDSLSWRLLSPTTNLREQLHNHRSSGTSPVARLKAQASAASISPPLPLSLNPNLSTSRPSQRLSGYGEGDSVFPSISSAAQASVVAGAPSTSTAGAGGGGGGSLSAEDSQVRLQAQSLGRQADDEAADVDEEGLETEGETGAAVLQCRATSLSILEQIDAQKQFIDRLRIQHLCAEHLAAWQERRRQRRQQAAQQIRRVGFGAITRVYLARRYRFSGYHFWVRQPAVYRLKLTAMHYDVSALTPRQVHDIWAHTVDASASLLQRVMRASRERQRLGEQYQFCHYYVTRVRPAVEASIWGRMAQVYEVCLLHWVVGYGLLYLKEMRESVQSGAIWHVTARDSFFKSVWSDWFVICLSELAGREKLLRDAIKSHEKRARLAIKYALRAARREAAAVSVTSNILSYSSAALTADEGEIFQASQLKDGVLIQVNSAPSSSDAAVPVDAEGPAAGRAGYDTPVRSGGAAVTEQKSAPGREEEEYNGSNDTQDSARCALQHGSVAAIDADTVVPLRRRTSAPKLSLPPAQPPAEPRSETPREGGGDSGEVEGLRSPTTTTTNNGTVRYRHGREVGEGKRLREALSHGGQQDDGDDGNDAGSGRVRPLQSPAVSVVDSAVPDLGEEALTGCPLSSDPDRVAPLKSVDEREGRVKTASTPSPAPATAALATSSDGPGTPRMNAKPAAISAEAYKDRLRAAQARQAAAGNSGGTPSTSSPTHRTAGTTTGSVDEYAHAGVAGLAMSQSSHGSSSQPLSTTRPRGRLVSLQLENNEVRVPGLGPSTVSEFSSSTTMLGAVGKGRSSNGGADAGSQQSRPSPQEVLAKADRKGHVNELERKHREEERERLLAYRARMAKEPCDDDAASASSGGRPLDGATSHSRDEDDNTTATSSSVHHGGRDRIAAAAQLLQDFHFSSRALPLFAEAALYQHTLYGYFLWPIITAPLVRAHGNVARQRLECAERAAREAILDEYSIAFAMLEMARVHSVKGCTQLQVYRTWGEQTAAQLHQYDAQLRVYYSALAASRVKAKAAKSHGKGEVDAGADVEMRDMPNQSAKIHNHTRHGEESSQVTGSFAFADAKSVPQPMLNGAEASRWIESYVPGIQRAAAARRQGTYDGEFTPSSTTTEGTMDESQLNRRGATGGRSHGGGQQSLPPSGTATALRYENANSSAGDDDSDMAATDGRGSWEADGRGSHQLHPRRPSPRHADGEGDARVGRAREGHAAHRHSGGHHHSKADRPGTAGARSASSAAPPARPASAAAAGQFEQELKTVQSDALRQALARYKGSTE